MRIKFTPALTTALITLAMAAAMLRPPLVADLRAQSEAKKPAPPTPKVKVGEMAPDFKLQSFDGASTKEVSLSDYQGKKNVVLAFFVFAFTPG